MKNIKNLISGFFERAGSYVFLATFIARGSSFLTHLLMLYLIPKKELGVVIYTLSIVAFLLPMAGLGVQQGLIRYGARLKSTSDKEALFIYAFKKGIAITLLLIGIIFLTSNFINFEFSKTSVYFKVLSFSILTQFLLSLVRIYFRLHHQNKKYAIVEITYAILFLVIATVLAYFYKELGYIIAIIGVPLIVFLIFFNQLKINFNNKKKLKITNFSFWKYGFFAGLATVTTILLVEIDNILIGNLLKDEFKVTLYKYISFIPVSLLFLPRVLITTDFVYLTERIKDKKYIVNYIKSYFSIFVSMSFVLLLISYFFSDKIVLLFGKDFANYGTTFSILMFGITGILILRGLFGNLLSVIGKAHLNFIIAIIALVVNVFSNHYYIPKYGILGAAITSAIIMWITGLLSLFLFFYNYKKLIK